MEARGYKLKSNSIGISEAPDVNQIEYKGEIFRPCSLDESLDCIWSVFAGHKGTIIAYKPKHKSWFILKPTKKNTSYWFVSVATSKSQKYWQPYVAELVLYAFKGKRPDPTSVGRHLNDNPSDNSIENLEWGSRSENSKEMHRNRNSEEGSSDKVALFPIKKTILKRIRDLTNLKGKKLEAYIEGILMAHISEK